MIPEQAAGLPPNRPLRNALIACRCDRTAVAGTSLRTLFVPPTIRLASAPAWNCTWGESTLRLAAAIAILGIGIDAKLLRGALRTWHPQLGPTADWFSDDSWDGGCCVPTPSDNAFLLYDSFDPDPPIRALANATVSIRDGGRIHIDHRDTMLPWAAQFANGVVVGASGGTVEPTTGGTGAFQIEAGTVLSLFVSVGATSSVGTVSLSSPTAFLSIVDDLTVGRSGHGYVHVADGSDIFAETIDLGRNPGGRGIVSVYGSPMGDPSTLLSRETLTVGRRGYGELHVGGQATVSTGPFLVASQPALGGEDGTAGEVIVDGRSSWTSSDVAVVGEGGKGLFQILGGSTATMTSLELGRLAGATGRVTVDGYESSLDVASDLTIAPAGFGELIVKNLGSVTSGSLDVGAGGFGLLSITEGAELSSVQGILGSNRSSLGVAQVDGIGSRWTNTLGLTVGGFGDAALNITGGGEVVSDSGRIGGSDINSSGEVHVRGAGSTWTTTGQKTPLTVGGSGTGNLSIADGAMVASGSGLVAEDATATGRVTIDGHGSTWLLTRSDADLEVGRAGTGIFRIQKGATVQVPRDYLMATSSGSTSDVKLFDAQSSVSIGNDLVIGGNVDSIARLEINDGRVTVGGVTALHSQSTLTIHGGTLHTGSLDNASGGQLLFSEAAIIVDGGPMIPGSNDLILGDSSISSLRLTNGATMTLVDDIVVGSSGAAQFSIENGSTVDSLGGRLGDGVGASGVVEVGGAGSMWTLSGAMTVGGQGQGHLTITGGGMVMADDETSVVGTVDGPSGAVIRGTGSVWSVPTLNIDGTGTVSIVDGGAVKASESVFLFEGSKLVLDGGSLSLEGLTNMGGTFRFLAGTLHLNGGVFSDPEGLLLPSQGELSGSGNVSAPLRGLPGSVIKVYGTLAIGDQDSPVGFLHQGVLEVGGSDVGTSAVTLRSASFAHLGALTQLDGGSLSAAGGVVIGRGDNLIGHGIVAGKVASGFGSTISAQGGNLDLGDDASVVGFASEGELHAGANVVTLRDANQAQLGALTTLGDGAAPGTLVANNGIILDFGGNVTGWGTIDTPNDAAKPLTYNGSIVGNSLMEPINLTGYVKGVGTCDNCHISGTDAPGFSTATVNRGSVHYNGVLEIEIGGSTPGSGFDQINHILGDGVAELGGLLDIQLVDGFTPSSGDQFEFLTAMSMIGAFDNVSIDGRLVTSGSDGSFLVSYDRATNTVMLSDYLTEILAGDYNNDGVVGAADYTAWRDNLGAPAGTLANDTDGGVIGPAQYATWKANFGATSGSGSLSGATVPEPNGVLLVAWASVVASLCRRRARGGELRNGGHRAYS